jgi:putative ABC transport system permease protein
MHVGRVDLVAALAEGASGATEGVRRGRAGRLRTYIMAGQIAVACLLLIGAALLVRSFTALVHADRGYDPANVLTARVDLPSRYTAAQRAAFVDAIVPRVRALPGVTHAASGTGLPLVSIGGNASFRMRSPADPSIELPVQTMLRTVSSDYFGALGIRLVQGRTLSENDTGTSRPVIVVNRSFARQYLGGDPVGAHVPLSLGEGRPECEVVGVVQDMRQADVTDAPAAEVFASYRQTPERLQGGPVLLALRSTQDPALLVPLVRAAVRAQDPLLMPDSVMTMEERVMTSLAKPRTYAVVMAGFGVSALIIAAVGLFGVLSYSVARRSREIGVRTALGATSWNIVTLVLRQAVAITAGGVAIGVWSSFAVMQYLGRFLYGVTAHDTTIFCLMPVSVSIVALVACAIPAHRAASVDPLVVLRSQ